MRPSSTRSTARLLRRLSPAASASSTTSGTSSRAFAARRRTDLRRALRARSASVRGRTECASATSASRTSSSSSPSSRSSLFVLVLDPSLPAIDLSVPTSAAVPRALERGKRDLNLGRSGTSELAAAPRRACASLLPLGWSDLGRGLSRPKISTGSSATPSEQSLLQKGDFSVALAAAGEARKRGDSCRRRRS